MNDDRIKYFNDKMYIIQKKNIPKYLGKVPLLVWYDNKLVKITRDGDAKQLSIADWEEILKEKKYPKTLSSFVYFFNKEFFENKVILSTEEAHKVLFYMLETINDEL